jgi:hypothetical protein
LNNLRQENISSIFWFSILSHFIDFHHFKYKNQVHKEQLRLFYSYNELEFWKSKNHQILIELDSLLLQQNQHKNGIIFNYNIERS